jgi:hypothetical protein
MKHFFLSLFMLISFGISAQLQLSEIGIPDDMIAFENSVLTGSQINAPKVSSTNTVQWTRTTPGLTGYALNFIHDKITDDYKYEGKSGNQYIFKKPEINFTTNGINYKIDPVIIFISKVGDKTTFKVVEEKSSYTLLVNRKRVTYTAQAFAELANMTIAQLWERDADYYFATDRNPATHITSVFVTVGVSDLGFTGQVYVNLQPANNYGGKITSYNKSGISYIVRWKLYNDCTALTATSGGFEKGNFGLCELRGPTPMGTEANPIVFEYHASKEYAVVECQIEELPAQGKNFMQSGYFTVNGCDQDDPCGPSRRLPRKPVN